MSLCKRDCSSCVMQLHCQGCSLCEIAFCSRECNRCSSLCPKRPASFSHLKLLGGGKLELNQNNVKELPIFIPVVPDHLPKRMKVRNTIGVHGGKMLTRLKDTPETWRQIETICEVAKRHGAQVNFETGGHVHIGAENALDGKRQRWRRFFKMSTGYENVFHKLAGGEQGLFRGSHYAASSRNQNREGITRYMPSEGTTNEFQSILGDISNGKYQSINIGTFTSKKTVEFRAFNGTLNPGVIQANVKYAAGLINSAERSRTRRGDGFEVTEQDTRRGNIINNYQQIENAQSDKAIIDVLDSVCSRKEDKVHLLSVLMRNQWSNMS